MSRRTIEDAGGQMPVVVPNGVLIRRWRKNRTAAGSEIHEKDEPRSAARIKRIRNSTRAPGFANHITIGSRSDRPHPSLHRHVRRIKAQNIRNLDNASSNGKGLARLACSV